MRRPMVYMLAGVMTLAVAGALIGLFVGMNIGGNFFTSFQFGTWTGYEATGMLGMLIGGLFGASVGGLLARRYTKRAVKVRTRR